MPMERTFAIDRDLARRAERKLYRSGRTLDDSLEYALSHDVKRCMDKMA